MKKIAILFTALLYSCSEANPESIFEQVWCEQNETECEVENAK